MMLFLWMGCSGCSGFFPGSCVLVWVALVNRKLCIVVALGNCGSCLGWFVASASSGSCIVQAGLVGLVC